MRLFLVPFLFLALAANAQKLEPTLTLVEVERHEARTSELTLPVYPAAVTQPGTRVIKLKLSVDHRGHVIGAEITSDEVDAPFVAAVKSVLPHWRFMPAYDPAACKPHPSSPEVRVDFVDDGTRKFVQIAAPRVKPAPVVPKTEKSGAEPVVGSNRGSQRFGYPKKARVHGVEISADLLLRCKTDGTTELTSLIDVFQGRWAEESVEEGVKGMKCRSGPEPFCMYISLNFCLENDWKHPSPHCEKNRAKKQAVETPKADKQ